MTLNIDNYYNTLTIIIVILKSIGNKGKHI